MGFVQRKIDVSVQLTTQSGTNQPNTFVESGTDTVKLSGLRTKVQVQNSGAAAGNHAQVKVYGIPPSLMNQLATLGIVFNLVPKNTLTITAGDDETGMSSVFTGTIWAAYGDYASQPDVPFHFECLSGAADAAIAIPASSFTGSADVATIMSGLARQMNLGFENNGVNAKLSSPYLSGSAKAQAQKVVDWAGIEWTIDGDKLAIWPRGGNRDTPNVPVISPATGMVGYPAFTRDGIIVKTIFNPQISFGSLVKVESSLLRGIEQAQKPQQIPNTPARSSVFPTTWAVNKIDHMLDASTPRGEWVSTIYAYDPGFAKTILPPK